MSGKTELIAGKCKELSDLLDGTPLNELPDGLTWDSWCDLRKIVKEVANDSPERKT